jgi:hypothetical protein
MMGTLYNKDNVRATNAHTFKGGPIPGPLVYAINPKIIFLITYILHTYLSLFHSFMN